MNHSKSKVALTTVLMFAGLSTLAGCATRSYVRQQIAPVSERVTGLEATSSELGERIDAVDGRAQQDIAEVRAAADAAAQAAARADESAAVARRLAETAGEGGARANDRVTALESRIDALNTYSVVSSVAVTFGFDDASLTDAGRMAVDGIVARAQSGDLVEVVGYTDSTGSVEYNLDLSRRRAEAAQRYLVTRGVGLYRVSIIGFGEDGSRADNATTQGREQNRRVEIRLLRQSGAPTSD